MIKAVLFDFIGTTVKEADSEIINQRFEKHLGLLHIWI
jgi:hypothetical protein